MQVKFYILTYALLFLELVLSTGLYTSLGDIFQGQLANLTDKPRGNPALGGQDFTHCCLLAVNESLEIDNGNLAFRPGQKFLHGNVSTFLSYQFPCTASYNGSQGDQPQVTIPYSWCHSNCGGWAISQASRPSDWIEPLIGFILPTIVFCFTIPRRRSLTIPRQLFPESSLFVFPENLTLFYKVPAAIILMIIDILQWVITCVVMAGPMLLSGMLEVMFDSRILKILSKNKDLSTREKAHLLLLILIGNLDEEPAWQHSKNFVKSLENDNTKACQTNIVAIKSRLVSLLKSQTGFGTSVGIGVVVFVASFLYCIGSIKAKYSDGGAAHSLALGCFWMTIGNVAVVGRVLLTDDPSAFGAATAADEKSSPRPKPTHHSNSISQQIRKWLTSSMRKRRLLLPAGFNDQVNRTNFSSRYKTAWMWNRGSTKAMWIAKFSEEYPGLGFQENLLKMNWLEMIFILALPTLLLFFIPSFLGGMTSYVTPTVGLSCRSMVPLLYSVAQFILITLWLCDWKFWKRTQDGRVLTMKEARNIENKRMTFRGFIWYSVFLVCVILALVTAIGGTMFQTVGLFNNCLCWIPIKEWANRWSPDATMHLGGDSSEQIHAARSYWIPIGISATVFLLFTTYTGWQYQYRLRRKFTKLVSGISCQEHDSVGGGDQDYGNVQLQDTEVFETKISKDRATEIHVEENQLTEVSLTPLKGIPKDIQAQK